MLYFFLSCFARVHGAGHMLRSSSSPAQRKSHNTARESNQGEDASLVCLKEHEKDLTPCCREKVAGIEKRLEEAKQICAVDTEKFCKGIQPGEGRIAKCLNEHIEEISPDCREKVSGLKKMIPEKKPNEKQ